MVAIITQARINSTRLPNKIFREAGGMPFLQHHIERLRKTGLDIIVATTNDGSEHSIVEFCRENDLKCFRGDQDDVLKRFYEAAVFFNIDTIIRVTSDCPLIDPNIIKNGLNKYSSLPQGSYHSNAVSRSYPRGMDYEIFSFELLKNAFEYATDAPDREHVTPYIWKNKSGKVNISYDIKNPDDSDLRITLDTAEDQELLTRLIEDHHADELTCDEIINVLRANESLVSINSMIEQKKIN